MAVPVAGLAQSREESSLIKFLVEFEADRVLIIFLPCLPFASLRLDTNVLGESTGARLGRVHEPAALERLRSRSV